MQPSRKARVGIICGWLSVAGLVIGLALLALDLMYRYPTCRFAMGLAFLVAPTLAVVARLMGDFSSEEAGRKLANWVLAAAVVTGVFLSPVLTHTKTCWPAASEAVAINNLRQLRGAIAVHIAVHGGEPPEAFDEIAKSHMDPRPLTSGEEEGYMFTYVPGPAEADGKRRHYTILARPLQFGKTGKQNFFTDETGVIRFTTENRPANSNDCPVEDWQACKR